ncbi:predicted protein [Naegleria gruberi]|uniref:Predicted protein n=1 Tax=Naegleria gruberi TaxID=5762 RepID=D2VM65_NAEGR|nr:uncharacterized protein NAEGRDRAFT_70026 [Naegleria gruberi]EFC41932.1 predicted protein [Naegleria gruberi]|eukprot:XP_002674676.1 predicted protein [Naegleria gruberi strain NEG-M]
MEQLRKEFQKLDSRKDGKCDPSQFKKVLSRFGVTSGINNVVKRFSNEGLVNYNDFLGYFEESRTIRKQATIKQNDITPSPQQTSPRPIEKPSPSQKPQVKKVENIESKLYTLRTNIEKDLKNIDKNNSGSVPVENFKNVLGKCFENQDVIKSIVGSVSNGKTVNYELFLSLISSPPSSEIVSSTIEQGSKSDKRVFNNGSKMMEHFKSSDPLRSGLVDETYFNNVISKYVDPFKAEKFQEKVAHHSFDGKVDYNAFMTNFAELSTDEEELRGIKCFPRPPSCILDSNITYPNLKGLATFPRKDSLGTLLSTDLPSPSTQSINDITKPSPTYYSRIFAPPDPFREFEQKDIVLQFSEYDGSEEGPKKRGKKISQPLERDEKSPRKRQISGSEKESDDNPLSISSVQTTYEKIMETKKKNNDMREGLRKVKEVFKKNKNISSSLTETLDGMGQLKPSDLDKFLSKNGVTLSEDQLTFVVQKCDRNGDGMLDYFDIANNLLHDTSHVNAFDSHLSLNGSVKDGSFEQSPASPRKILNKAQIQSPDFKIDSSKPNPMKTLEHIQHAIADIDENLKTPVKLKERTEMETPIQTPINLTDIFDSLKDVIVQSPVIETPKSKTVETPKTQSTIKKKEILSTSKEVREVKEVDRALVKKISEKIKISKTMQQAFQYFDKDRDGNITPEEFSNGLSNMGFTVTKSEASQIMGLVSSDPKLSYANFSKLVEDSYWDKFPESKQRSPKSTPKKVINRSDEIVNKKIRSELMDYSSLRPAQIRESMRTFDKERNSWLPPDKFKKALKVINPNLSEWMIDRAVRQSLIDTGKCDYNKFFDNVGFDLPSDEIEFRNIPNVRNYKRDTILDLSDVRDPLLCLEINNFGRITNNSVTIGSGEIISHNTPVKGDYPLEKHLGRKSAGKPLPDTFNVSDMEPQQNEPQSPRRLSISQEPSTPQPSSPRTGRYSSTPPQRNPLFGDDNNTSQKPIGIKVGFVPTGTIVSTSQLRTNYDKKENLNKGLASFVSERLESPKKVIRSQTPQTDVKRSSKKLYSDIKQQTEINIERGEIDTTTASPRRRNQSIPPQDTKQAILSKVEEHHKTARDAFRKISSSGKNIASVTINEMQKALKDMNLHIPSDELKKTFEVKDNTEKINFEKFASVIKPSQIEPTPQEPRYASPPMSPRSQLAVQNRNQQSSLKELLNWDSKKAVTNVSTSPSRSQSVPTKKDVFRGSGNIITWM